MGRNSRIKHPRNPGYYPVTDRRTGTRFVMAADIAVVTDAQGKPVVDGHGNRVFRNLLTGELIK